MMFSWVYSRVPISFESSVRVLLGMGQSQAGMTGLLLAWDQELRRSGNRFLSIYVVGADCR